MTETARRRHRRLLDILLLPVALLVVLLEDIVWRGARRALRRLSLWPPVARLQAGLARLPGWAALPLFLIPETLGRVGEFWALVLLVHGHRAAAAGLYVSVRLGATLLVVFVYHACEPALLRIGWFAFCVAQVHRVRDWALDLIRPLRERIHRFARAAPGLITRRYTVLRRAVARRFTKVRPASR